MLTFVEKKKAYKLAKSYQLTIYQEWKSIKDFITSIQLGKVEDVIDGLSKAIEKPTVYFAVREDDQFYYVLSMIYHAFDYSASIFEFVRKLDSHRHDTESVLLRIDKGSKIIDICTVYHYSHVFEGDADPEVFIEKEGHGIRPMNCDFIDEGQNYILYNGYKLQNMLSWSKKRWNSLRKEFSKYGVNLPDGQYDAMMRLQTHVGKRYGGAKHLIGDIWNRPDKLFELAEKKGKI